MRNMIPRKKTKTDRGAGEGGRDAEGGDEKAGHHGSDEARQVEQARVEGYRGGELFGAHEARDERQADRLRESLDDTEHENECEQNLRPYETGEHERCERCGLDGLRELGPANEPDPLEAVSDDAADRREESRRESLRHRHDAEPRGRLRELPSEPTDADFL